MYALLFVLAVAAPPEAPTFVVVSPADEYPSGRIVRLSRDFQATIKTASGETTVADVVSLRRADRVRPAFPTGPQLITTAGDRIAGTLVGGDGQSLRFLPSGVLMKRDQAWKVPLSAAVVVWIADTPADTPLDIAKNEWLAGIKNRDVLRFRNGDNARGAIDGIDPDADDVVFPFRPEQGEWRKVGASELAAIAFNPALARARKPKGAYARLVLLDGSRLAIANVAIADNLLNGEALFGQKITLPMSDVLALDVFASRATYVSDLKPKKVEQSGFLGVAWPFSNDRTVHGDALRVKTSLGEATADKGLGTRPRTVLTYDLAGKYRRFEALVGLDPTTAIRTKVAVRIFVDGKEQAIPDLVGLTIGNAVPVCVDVQKAKELTLVVDFGVAGGVGADVNWADARLIE